ncbi:DUF4857 domain-containing protein [Imhoffiella purpurea]|uniref:DUF4857 domain-containing protein n=1 Tax=Imhoffiella purpurea TaxID=1249627 RepID=W9V3U4_9GAMM|nr:DUF4857 domain-containing protein [Imhoffiella purpurea]EXJ14188.1 hypothetical protein D779_2859 [Imhoffiella purpurea]
MTARLARWSLLLLTILLLAIWIPQAKELLFDDRFGKTQLFYSPVIERFVYKELIGEGHQFVYRDQDGTDYDRESFETLIPFIYYKNMELWGRLPLVLGEHRFDKAAIVAERQVMEFKPQDLSDQTPRIQLFPLLESNPERARLRFPEDIMRPGERLDFIDSDANRLDPELTRTFTQALEQAGFRFPVRAAFGRVSILKAFDAGYFLLDSGGALFHLRRLDGAPEVAAVPIPEGIAVRDIKVTENKRHELIGFLLAEDGRLFLMTERDHDLIALDLPGYDPDRMELKILFNPLYRTAVYSDRETIHAVVMDRDYHPIDRYARRMAMARERPVDRVWEMLVPFNLNLHDPDSRYLSLDVRFHGLAAAIGVAASLLLALEILRLRGIRPTRARMDLLLVLFTGLYGLLALILIPPEHGLET